MSTHSHQRLLRNRETSGSNAHQSSRDGHHSIRVQTTSASGSRRQSNRGEITPLHRHQTLARSDRSTSTPRQTMQLHRNASIGDTRNTVSADSTTIRADTASRTPSTSDSPDMQTTNLDLFDIPEGDDQQEDLFAMSRTSRQSPWNSTGRRTQQIGSTQTTRITSQPGRPQVTRRMQDIRTHRGVWSPTIGLSGVHNHSTRTTAPHGQMTQGFLPHQAAQAPAAGASTRSYHTTAPSRHVRFQLLRTDTSGVTGSERTHGPVERGDRPTTWSAGPGESVTTNVGVPNEWLPEDYPVVMDRRRFGLLPGYHGMADCCTEFAYEEAHPVFNRFRGDWDRILDCMQDIFDRSYIFRGRHRNFLNLDHALVDSLDSNEGNVSYWGVRPGYWWIFALTVWYDDLQGGLSEIFAWINDNTGVLVWSMHYY